MKVTSIHLITEPNPVPLVLDFRTRSGSNPYLIKAADGLDVDEILRQYYGDGGGGTGRMYDLMLAQRAVVLRFALNPNFSQNKSYSDLRDDVYRFVASSRTGLVTLEFKNGATTVAVLSGYIAKVEAPQFSKTQDAQLTIACDDPMMKAPQRTVVDVSALDNVNTTIFDNESTAPHGFQFRLVCTGALASYSITDATAGKPLTVTPTSLGGFQVGDVLHGSTERGNKYLYLVRGASTYHLVDKVTPGSVWPLIFPGENQYSGHANMDWQYISYLKTYWGV